MKYYTKEQQIDNINRLINNYNELIKVIEELKPVVTKFDNKVFNKRFNEALKTVYPYIRVEMQYTSTQDILLCIPYYDFESKFDLHQVAGYNDYYLTRNLKFNITNNSLITYQKAATNEDKRIIAQNIVDALTDTQQYYKTQIEELQKALKQLDEYKKIVDEINRLNKELRNIPFEVRDICDLNLSIQTL